MMHSVPFIFCAKNWKTKIGPVFNDFPPANTRMRLQVITPVIEFKAAGPAPQARSNQFTLTLELPDLVEACSMKNSIG